MRLVCRLNFTLSMFESFLCWMMSQEIADVSYATDENKRKDGGDSLQNVPPRKAIVNSCQMTNVTEKEQEVQRKSISFWDREPAFFILWNTQTPTDFIGINFTISKNKRKNLDKLSNLSVKNSIKNDSSIIYLFVTRGSQNRELQSLTGVFRFKSKFLSNDPECDKKYINKQNEIKLSIIFWCFCTITQTVCCEIITLIQILK